MAAVCLPQNFHICNISFKSIQIGYDLNEKKNCFVEDLWKYVYRNGLKFKNKPKTYFGYQCQRSIQSNQLT